MVFNMNLGLRGLLSIPLAYCKPVLVSISLNIILKQITLFNTTLIPALLPSLSGQTWLLFHRKILGLSTLICNFLPYSYKIIYICTHLAAFPPISKTALDFVLLSPSGYLWIPSYSSLFDLLLLLPWIPWVIKAFTYIPIFPPQNHRHHQYHTFSCHVLLPVVSSPGATSSVSPV